MIAMIVYYVAFVCVEIANIGFHWALVGCQTFHEIRRLSLVFHWTIGSWCEFNTGLTQAVNSHVIGPSVER